MDSSEPKKQQQMALWEQYKTEPRAPTAGNGHSMLRDNRINKPTVGDACINYEYRYPKALFVNIKWHNTVSEMCRVLSNWKYQNVRAIVVTDGERILGLGDLGIGGVEISVGKLSLYVALGGVQPQWCLPVQLDVGTDNEQLLNDPNYAGLRQRRVRGEQYDQFIDNFMVACRKKFGHNTLVQFEDFGKNNADRLLKRYQDKYCTFNDDIQGTASVSVAGLLAAVRITGRKISESKFLFHGAGTAAIGISELLVSQMQIEGLSRAEACSRIFLVKSDGLVTKARDNLMDAQKPFAKEMDDLKDLGEVVKAVQPSAIIGVSTVRGAFTDSIIKDMASFNKRPIIFALSNPTSKSECTAEAAYHGTNKLAELVTDVELDSGSLYPSINKICEVSTQIAVAIAEECYKDGLAQLLPEPTDKELFVRSQFYKTDYEEMIPKINSLSTLFHDSLQNNDN